MEELIKIRKSESGKDVVSARSLHEFLGLKSNFTTWMLRMIDHGFVQGADYQSLSKKGRQIGGGQNKIEYAITVDMAKSIGMLQNNDKGKEIRDYFIECEKKLKVVMQTNSLPTYSEALRQLASSIEAQEQSKIDLEAAHTQIEEDKPKVVFANSVSGSGNSVLVRVFAKEICDAGFETGQNKVFDWLRDHKYLTKDQRYGKFTNEPYQQYINQGIFEVITRVIGSGSQTFTTTTTKITGKGQVYLTKKIKDWYGFNRKAI
jgi:anti-repressor protein